MRVEKLQTEPSFETTMKDHLDLLAEMNRDFVRSQDLGLTLQNAVVRITDYLNADGTALFMLDESGNNLRCDACYGATDITGMTLKSDQGIVGRCVQQDTGEIVRDVYNDPNFHKVVDDETGFTTKSILCAPMSVQGQKIGAIEVINKKSADGLFQVEDLKILEVLASSAGLAVLNARMAEALVEQERMQRELELAAEIQKSLLPSPKHESFPVAGTNFAARVVSGDFYDFFPLDDGRICFCIGDVSGKGMNAALLMAKTASIYRCLGKTIHDPGRLLALVNAEIAETTTRGMFVTMAGGIYDPGTGIVRIANAGHEPPLFLDKEGNYTDIPATTPPIGILPVIGENGSVKETTIQLDGGALYIFTDGVTEGYLDDGSEMGIDRLKDMFVGLGDKPVQERLDQVIQRFNPDKGHLRDDLTIIAIQDSGNRNQDQAQADWDLCERVLYLTFPSRPDRLKLVRAAVGRAAQDCKMSDNDMRDLILAVDEACQNVIRHAYKGVPDGEVILEMRRCDGKIAIMLRDFAEPVDVETIKPRDINDIRPGGLGTHIIREIMDEVEFLPPPEDGGNILKMTKLIA